MSHPIVINNWAVVTKDPYLAPELQHSHLNGNVENHPKHEKGKLIITTPIVGLIGDYIVTKSGSIYELGTIDPAYENVFPNAKERLFVSLNKIMNNKE